MQDSNTVLKLSDSVTYQKMNADGQTVLLDLSGGTIFTCNDTTRDFLEALGDGRSLEQIVERMQEIYDVDSQRLKKDMEIIAEKLLSKGLIVKFER